MWSHAEISISNFRENANRMIFQTREKKYEIDWGPEWGEIGGNCAENCGGKCGKCGNMPKNAGTADRMIAPIPNSPLRFPRRKKTEKNKQEKFFKNLRDEVITGRGETGGSRELVKDALPKTRRRQS